MTNDFSPADLLMASVESVPAKSCLAAGGLALGLYLLYRQSLPTPIPGIPYDEESAKTLMGDLRYFQQKEKEGLSPRSYYPEMFTKHGAPVVQYFMGPFSKPAVAIGDWREGHDLILRRSKQLVKGQLNADAWAGTVPAHFIGMEDNNPGFKAAKALGKDLMTPSFLHEVNAPASYQKVLNFVKLWKLKAALAGDYAFDAAGDLGCLTYDIIMAAAFNINDDETQICSYIKKLEATQEPATIPSSKMEVATFPAADSTDMLRALFNIAVSTSRAFVIPSTKLFHFFNNLRPTMRKSYRDRDAIIKSYILDSVRRLEKAGDDFKPASAIDFIVMRESTAAKKEERKPDFTSDTVVAITFGYILGGQDSTHSTLSFLVKRLGASQEAQKVLRTELRKAFPEAFANQEQPPLQELVKAQIPYLDAVIEEVLRIDTPAVGINKETTTDIDVLGYTIPKNTLITVGFMGATYHEKGYHPEKGGEALRSETSRSHAGSYGVHDWALSSFPPNEFHPERWLEESADGQITFNPKAGPFLSFSSGTRVCWGKRLAYLELKLVTTVLVWNFAFKRLPANLEDWAIAEDLFLKPKNCRVQLGSAWDE